jgi:hypothetical protein
MCAPGLGNLAAGNAGRFTISTQMGTGQGSVNRSSRIAGAPPPILNYSLPSEVAPRPPIAAHIYNVSNVCLLPFFIIQGRLWRHQGGSRRPNLLHSGGKEKVGGNGFITVADPKR